MREIQRRGAPSETGHRFIMNISRDTHSRTIARVPDSEEKSLADDKPGCYH